MASDMFNSESTEKEPQESSYMPKGIWGYLLQNIQEAGGPMVVIESLFLFGISFIALRLWGIADYSVPVGIILLTTCLYDAINNKLFKNVRNISEIKITSIWWNANDNVELACLEIEYEFVMKDYQLVNHEDAKEHLYLLKNLPIDYYIGTRKISYTINSYLKNGTYKAKVNTNIIRTEYFPNSGMLAICPKFKKHHKFYLVMSRLYFYGASKFYRVMTKEIIADFKKAENHGQS